MIDGVESSIISRANVAISNKLQNKDLIIHCKDRVRDDGYHSLAPNQRLVAETLTNIFYPWNDQGPPLALKPLDSLGKN
ncbi:hypothetical protein Lal_00005827 [Lupinus albus]|nr:hypothetical protein Lal_00005827 [Lupinus albus]